MGVASFQEFCGGQFWNGTLLINNTWPQFTDCFLHSALIWVPVGFILLMLPCYVTSVNKYAAGVHFQFTAVNGLKLFCCLTLCVLSLAQLVIRTKEEAVSQSVAAYLGDGLHTVSYLLLAVMTQYERLKGAQSSAVPFFFWMMTSLCSVIPLYTNLIKKNYSNTSFVLFTVTFVLQLTCLVLTGFVDYGGLSTKYTSMGETACPETSCSFPSYVVFWWMNKLMVTGYRRDLEETDLCALPLTEHSSLVLPQYDKLMEQEIQRCKKLNRKRKPPLLSEHKDIAEDAKPPLRKRATEKTGLLPNNNSDFKTHSSRDDVKPSFFTVICKLYGKEAAVAAIMKILSDVIMFLCPVSLGLLMTYLENRQEGREWHGYVLCVGMFLAIVIKSVLYGHSLFQACKLSTRLKTTLIAAIYKKALVMSNSAKQSSTAGEIMNLMSVDAQRIGDLINVLLVLLVLPVHLSLAVALLYLVIGPAILFGVLFLVLLVPISVCLLARQGALQRDNLAFKDARVRLYDEILKGMKVLKLYTWEPSFREKIREIRLKEVAILFKMAVINTVLRVTWGIYIYLVSLLTFATYVLIDRNNHLTPAKAFVTLSVFNMLGGAFNVMSTPLMGCIQASVSIKRINKFFTVEELDPNAVTRDESTCDYKTGSAISIECGTFSWHRTENSALTDINLTVGEGRLVAVVGPVGCGKSSLISAILGEMDKVKGTVTTRGSIAYVPQQAWILNATVRDNILFGKAYIGPEYERVLEACQLKRDAEMLPAGDMTEIGERGINLSGGQKQRVSVARAVYSDSDVYLLDDPLSALDAHVGKAMFKEVIGHTGILKNKTRLLVVHGVHWLTMVDEIIVMHDGKISERGSFDQLMSQDGPFAQFLKTYLIEADNFVEEDDSEIAEIRSNIRKRMDSVTSDAASSDPETNRGAVKKRGAHKRAATKIELELKKRKEKPNKTAVCSEPPLGKLTSDEEIQRGTVKRVVFKDYLNAAGILPLTLAFLSFCIFQVLSVGSNVWLKVWAGDPRLLNVSAQVLHGNSSPQNASAVLHDTPANNHTPQKGNEFYLGMYGLLGVLQFIFLLTFNSVFWTRMVTAARVLHSRLADRLLRAPMAFFDSTPIGRILNRVSRDVDTVDNYLPGVVRDCLVLLSIVAVTLAVIVIQTPLACVVLAPLCGFYCVCQRLYVPTSRQLKSIESVTRSPIYALFSETLSGASSIRAYGATGRLLKESMSKVDKNQVFYYASQCAARWLQVNVDVLSAFVVLFAGVFAIVQSTSDPAVAGLSVSYALQVCGILAWMTRQICEFETSIVSVERLKEYSELQAEAEWILAHKRPPADWPQKGEVTFNNYQTRYREGLDLVLKGVNCAMRHGEKVGIVGRTGAGKSSLALSLFRLIESAGGAIYIDGVNIADMGLHDLRSKLTILPQDPVLFSGSLRINLDPFDENSDEQLWTALDRAHLKSAVTQLPAQLHFQCGEEGANFSVGQRQLVCLARALLQRTKILVLDEATAAVDMETDALIQNTIRSAFSTCTVITIAHRINTILDYDKILVMDAGTVKEFASPQELLSDQTSAFYALAKDAGLV